MSNKSNIKNRFKESIRKGKIEEKVGNMDLYLISDKDSRYVTLEHNGESYVFLFDYDTCINDLFNHIKYKVHKRNKEPIQGYENFTWNKANTLIRFLQKARLENYL